MVKKRDICLYVVFLLIAVMFYHLLKPLPSGMDYVGDIEEGSVEFLYDVTYMDDGVRVSEQRIFDSMFESIDGAKEFILVDMFLFNPFQGKVKEEHRELSNELTNLLIKKRKEGLDVYVITDPINLVYGGEVSPNILRLKEEGVDVIFTDLSKLRDSNFLYSAFWRVFIQWFGNSENGVMPHPFKEGKVSVRTYLHLLNFKANHHRYRIWLQ